MTMRQLKNAVRDARILRPVTNPAMWIGIDYDQFTVLPSDLAGAIREFGIEFVHDLWKARRRIEVIE